MPRGSSRGNYKSGQSSSSVTPTTNVADSSVTPTTKVEHTEAQQTVKSQEQSQGRGGGR